MLTVKHFNMVIHMDRTPINESSEWIPAYHGSLVTDIKELEVRQPPYGVCGIYVSTQPDIASRHAKSGVVYLVSVRGPFAPREYTVGLVGDTMCYQTDTNRFYDMIDRVKAEGYHGVYEDPHHNGLVVFEAKNVRLRFATGETPLDTANSETSNGD